MITLKIDNKEINIYREQKEDNLYVKTELKYFGNILPEIKVKVKEFVANEKFYNYHVCDIYKSYNFLHSGRKEIKRQFEDFIKPHSLADSFSEKLNQLDNTISDKINVLEKEKIHQDIIDNERKELDSLKNDSKVIDYPQVKFFTEENLNIEKENCDKIKYQLTQIKVCGFNLVASMIDSIILYYEAKEKIKNIDELINIINLKESDINFSLKNSYHELEKLREIETNIKLIIFEKTKVENAKNLLEVDSCIKSDYCSEINGDIKIYLDAIIEIDKELRQKQSEIKAREKGNNIITALSNLVIGREGYYKYKTEGNKKCPLCGSDQNFYKTLDASDLAVEAEAYLNQNKSELVMMKKNEQEVIEKLNTKFEQLKYFIIKYLDNKVRLKTNP